MKEQAGEQDSEWNAGVPSDHVGPSQTSHGYMENTVLDYMSKSTAARL